MATNINCNPSEHFCCRHCGADVALVGEPGGDLSYQCQNPRCQWAGDVDCPEALALKGEGLTLSPAELAELAEYSRDWDAERESMIAELARYAMEWDAYAAALAIQPPDPTPPAAPAAGRTAQQRAADKAAWNLAQGVKIVRVKGGWLVPSGTRAGVIHRVNEDGTCSCEAGSKGKGCWHVEAVALVEAEPAEAVRKAA